MLTVTQLARQCGVAAHVVRYYARIGLIHADQRHANGYRLFDASAVARLDFVRAAKHLGFTLNEIKQIVARADCGSSPCPEVRALLRERIAKNRTRLDAMLTQQARMEAALVAWEEMPDRVPDGHSVCHLIESFAPEAKSLGEPAPWTTSNTSDDTAAVDAEVHNCGEAHKRRSRGSRHKKRDPAVRRSTKRDPI